ncbi:MAG: prenyltransferase/squalene oxidase repeat-containing protein [Planctomycetota bacterium]
MMEERDDRHADHDPPASRLPGWLTETPYWAISAVAHVILVLFIGGIVLLQTEDKRPEVRTVVRAEFKPQPYDPRADRDVIKKPVITETEREQPIVKHKPNEIQAEIPNGVDENKLTNKNLEAEAINDAFAIGGGGDASAYGNRSGRGSLSREGGNKATEAAVLAALHWLRRHQHPDGHWSGADFRHQCDDPSKPCAMADEGYSDGRGFADHDVGLTGLAMLAFLGYAHTHRDGEVREFRTVMKRAMDWMLAQQVMKDGENPDHVGRYGPTTAEEWMYSHAIATMAMGELLFLSQDRLKLRRSVEAATHFCMASQNEGFGWKYKYKGGTNDTSVTGWMVLALKTSKSCAALRLVNTDKEKFTQHFDWALAWFARSTAKISGRTGYEAPGDAGSKLLTGYPEPYPFSKEPSCMTAVALLCRLFAGENHRSDDIKKGVSVLAQEPPTWARQRGKQMSKINMYYWYYATYAMFQYGGQAWKDWNLAMQAALLPNQRRLGCEDGSWDPVGEWGLAGGRVYATAINAMTLEVYYRFQRTQ